MANADHPTVPFVESRTLAGSPAYTPGRPDGPPLWIVIHDMEFPERDDAAEWTAAYFARGADGRSVSSHYCADRDSIVQCVRTRDVAWTVGNRPGNYRGINWELAGYARQTREQWLDDYGRAMLARVAEVMRLDMGRYQIPARTLTDEQVRVREKGLTSHAQLGRVFGGSDHTDPGAGFPWDHLIDLLTGDDMPTVEDLVKGLLNTPLGRSGPTVGVALQATHTRVERLEAGLAALRAAVEGMAVGADAARILAGLPDAVADAVVDEQARRLAE